MKPIQDHHLLLSSDVDGAGRRIQKLVPVGSEEAASMKGDIKTGFYATVDGDCLQRWLDAQKKPVDAAEAEQCEVLYRTYPRRVGKPAALKAIKAAMKITSFDVLMDRTQAYAVAVSQWSEADKQFVPYPQRWFRDRRFEDDPKLWERFNPKKTATPDYDKGF